MGEAVRITHDKPGAQVLIKKASLALLAAAGMAVSSASMAQGNPADTGFYAGVSFGQSDANIDCVGTTSCDNKDTAWKIFGGYQINRNFAVEFGYADLGEATASVPSFFFPGLGVVPASNLSIETTVFELVGIGSIPVADRFSLYGKAGVYRAESDVSVSFVSLPTVTSSDSTTDFTFGFGARYDFTRNFGVRAEWQRYTGIDIGSTSETADVDVLSIGLVVRF
jgi:OOP family OmpA-OmpF porin